jgi:hypothetical protein
MLLNTMFVHTHIPDYSTRSEMVAIPKKGDRADPHNYRGISLMTSSLKLLLVVLTRRLNQAAETAKRFAPEQAGFRRLEECATQAACITEILKRRHLLGLRSVALFIDFKKAYDMVPHEALFRKISNFGVQGLFLAFVKQLYRTSYITVRVGSGKSALLTKPYVLQRGVRQG